MNVLFVCTGNTCRSPMAEGLCRMLNEDKKGNVVALSAGLHAFPGAPVSRESVLAVKEFVDISDHRARGLSVDFVNAADVIVTMTEQHKQAVQQLFPEYEKRLMTIRELAGEHGDVEDPYGSSQAVYNACGKEILRCLERGWTVLAK